MTVSLVIPGRNCQRTLRACLGAVVPLLGHDGLVEIIFVDDGSTDASAQIAAEFPAVTYLRGDGRGRGSARNLGWQAARGELIWFIDSDTVAEPDALRLLLPHLTDPQVAGVGGSYGNMERGSLLACLIHEEIVARHAAMPSEVDFLATFNVLYRRDVLAAVEGFSHLPRGQDTELAYRILEAGYRLRFEAASRVAHFHPTSWLSYLRTQRHHGAFRVCLYLRYPARARGDAYSGFVDHIQPPLAMLCLAALPLVIWPIVCWLPLSLFALLLLAQLPMTWRIYRRTGQVSYLSFAGLSALRAFWRGIGMVQGVFQYLLSGRALPYEVGVGAVKQSATVSR
ncbi:MAG TPA: glycosyltransferase [Pirellulaceae bacterium]|nr:glycosyltransferase [Pirellulaceae bacterium]